MSFRAIAAASALAVGCLEYSPHAPPTEADETGLNARAIERILALPAAPLRFAVVGDTQRAFDEAAEIVAAINARDDVQFVVQVGDFTNVGLRLEYEWMNDVFARLRVPYLVMIGNHDHFSNGEAIYEAMFGPKDFAFTRGRVRLVFYDSNSVSHDFDGTVPDVAWVEAALAPGPDHDRALAFAHIPPGGGSLFDDALTAPLLEALARAGVALSIHGHLHRFAEWEQDGVRLVAADSADHRSYLVVSETAEGFTFERVDL